MFSTESLFLFLNTLGINNAGAKDIRDLLVTITRAQAELGVFITLKAPKKAIVQEARAYGLYHYDLFDRQIPKIQIVTVGVVELRDDEGKRSIVQGL